MGQSKINFQSTTLGFVAVSQGSRCTSAASAEHLSLIGNLAAEINPPRQTKLSQPFPFKWMVYKTCGRRLQAVIQLVDATHKFYVSALLYGVEGTCSKLDVLVKDV